MVRKMNVPKLRFKEFNDEWIETNLGQSTTFKQGIQVDVENQFSEPFDDSVRFIRIVDYTQNTKDKRYIVKPKNANFVDEHDVVLVRYGATAGFVGHGITGAIANNMFTVTPNKKIDKDFLYTILKQEKIYKKLNSSNGSSAMPALNFGSVSLLKFKYPSISEQQKLYKFISLLDKKIELQTKKIEDLKLFKKGLLYRIFNKKNTNTNIENCIDYGKAGGTPLSSNKDYYDGSIPFLSIADITNQGKYIFSTEKMISQKGLDNSSAWLIPKNSLILSMYASYGLVAINKIELSTSQAMFNMIINKSNNVEYIYYYLEYLYQNNYYDKLVSTGTQSNLNADKVKKIKIYLPSIEEQNALSKLFMCVDDKIKFESNKLNKLNKLKKGLIQNMFV